MSDLTDSFREKTNYMKTWKPASAPSNRDRLELYALHKQSVVGDAPASIPNSATQPEKAKHQAWRAKKGVSQQEAMRLYIQECDRQVRTYGTTSAQTPQNTPTITNGGGDNNNNASPNNAAAPRGIAAIPLLCAAASESRPAYLRRLANTLIENAWWSRQEPLCATPGTLWSVPEAAVICIASLVERLSLTLFREDTPIPQKVVQSFLWPMHNALLSAWMGLILVYTILGAGVEFLQTVFWGSRRTGLSMTFIWAEKIQLSADSILTMCEPHQPLSARLVGLALLPFTAIVALIGAVQQATGGNMMVSAAFYVLTMFVVTWWYWFLVLPWFASIFLGAALLSGNCFALIEMAGV
ncbi:acyl-CoA-binding protein [Seminavis robusta]|uniref:Acyl-CoA-binding protein n=1 Tax=Seminavis robusta TaxID=568900 RepID=A0A9N8DX15_9STRA|nr:acyl-CoA-binding protein [Seminavis robusta]|eukprot:Sro440_g143480.1 acyl-CoA-binding protein (354) ;mRNA; f:36121-37276